MTMTDPVTRLDAVHAQIRALSAAIDQVGDELRSWTTGDNPQSIDEYAERRVRYLELSARLDHAVAQLELQDDDGPEAA